MGAMQQSLLGTAYSVAATLDTPIFVSEGAWANSTAAISVAAPPSYIDGDLLVLVLTSTNQTIGAPSTGGTWTQVSNSPQGTGTAGASQSIACAVYYKVASGTQAAASVADSGVLTTGIMFSFRKINTTTPIDVTAGSVLGTAGTTHTLPAVTTTSNNVLIAHCTGIGRDSLTTTNYSSPTNANLTGLTVQSSQSTSTANGGGIGLVTGLKATNGSTGTTSVTVAGAAKGAFITVGIAPSTNYAGTARVLGAYGTVSDFQALSSPDDSFASITLNTNGTLTCVGNGLAINEGWYSSESSGIGSSYWVRATTVSGSGSGTTGSWLALSTARTWSVGAPMGGNFANWVIKFEFSSDSGGATIVATTNCTLEAATEVDTIAL